METRIVNQIKIYKLLMNPMTANTEATNLMAISFFKNKLIDWMEAQKTEPYKDENWHKVFKKGSELEWYNPINSYDGLDVFGQGIGFEWTTQKEIDGFIKKAQDSFGFIKIPKIID